MKNTLFSGLMIVALVALIGAVGLLNTPSANAEPNCDKASAEKNKAGNFKGNIHCDVDAEPFPECEARDSNPQDNNNCKQRGHKGEATN